MRRIKRKQNKKNRPSPVEEDAYKVKELAASGVGDVAKILNPNPVKPRAISSTDAVKVITVNSARVGLFGESITSNERL